MIVNHSNKPIYLLRKLHISDLIRWIMSCAEEIVSDFDMLKFLFYNKHTKASDDRS